MPEEELQSLWLYGEMEPWRRGRNILLIIATFYAILQSTIFAAFLLGGALETALSFALGLVVWWLLFSFVWFGTNWVRWLLGAATLLYGFTCFIWGIRDQSIIHWSAGVLDLFIGAFCFAPSVHFFAIRQRERIRWPEKLIVAAVFLVLAASFFSALMGMNLYRFTVQREAEHYASTGMQKIFTENDTAYLLAEVTDEWRNQPGGNLAVTAPLTDKVVRLGDVENIRVTHTGLRAVYKFPMSLQYAGFVDGEGQAKCGPVRLRLIVTRLTSGWRINGFSWQCLNWM